MSSFQQLLSAQAKNHWPRTQGAKPSSADTAATIFFTVRFGAATVQGRPLFEGSIYMYFVQLSKCRRHANIFFAVCFGVATTRGQLLFKGSIYFYGKPEDTDDGWIRYIQVKWWWLLDTVSSTCSLSVLLSVMEMTCTTRIALALAWSSSSEIIRTGVRVPCILAAATIWGRHLFRSELSIMQRLFEGGDYLRAVTIWGRQLFESGDYLRVATIWRNTVAYMYIIELFQLMYKV